MFSFCYVQPPAIGSFTGPDSLKPQVAFLEWVDPIFPGGHWTPQIVELAGGSHPINPVRYVSAEHTLPLEPDSASLQVRRYCLRWELVACICCKTHTSFLRCSSCLYNQQLVCRGPGKGAKASFAMSHEALVEADCDWIVICPCGLDLRQTAKELPAMTYQQWW